MRRLRPIAFIIMGADCLLPITGCTSTASADNTSAAEIAVVDKLADALRRYSQHNHGKLPVRLTELTPKYIRELSDLRMNLPESASGEGSYPCLVAFGLPDPDAPSQVMIAFTASRFAIGRVVIDQKFNTWQVGEDKFQTWLAGIAVFSKTEPAR